MFRRPGSGAAPTVPEPLRVAWEATEPTLHAGMSRLLSEAGVRADDRSRSGPTGSEPHVILMEVEAAARAAPLLARARSTARAAAVVALVRIDQPAALATSLDVGYDDVLVWPTCAAEVRGRLARAWMCVASARALGTRIASLEGLFDHVTSSIVTVDARGCVSALNRAAARTLGADPAVWLGRSADELFGTDAVRRALAAQETRESRLDVTLIPGGSGSIDGAGARRLDVGMTLVRTDADAPPDVAAVLVFRDLGDRRQLEMEDRRVERLAAIGHMVAGFAHEIRNPLAGIQSLSEVLLGELGRDDPRREIAARIPPLLRRVERFVKAALEFGQPRPARRERHPVRALVEAALQHLGPRLAGDRPILEIEGTPWVDADGGQMVECLAALVENALEATGTARRVRIATGREVQPDPRLGAFVRIDVCDDGPGVPHTLLSRIFDPFYTTKPERTGLGLALAQTLVCENGGALRVASPQSGDTVFSVLLPEAHA